MEVPFGLSDGLLSVTGLGSFVGAVLLAGFTYGLVKEVLRDRRR